MQRKGVKRRITELEKEREETNTTEWIVRRKNTLDSDQEEGGGRKETECRLWMSRESIKGEELEVDKSPTHIRDLIQISI